MRSFKFVHVDISKIKKDNRIKVSSSAFIVELQISVVQRCVVAPGKYGIQSKCKYRSSRIPKGRVRPRKGGYGNNGG